MSQTRSKHDLIRQLREQYLTLDEAGKEAVLNQILTGYTTKCVPFHLQRLYRARALHEPRLFASLSHLWYPPAERARLGRANRAGRPMFYAAENWHTAFKETIGNGQVGVGLEVELRDADVGPLHLAIGADEILDPDQARLSSKKT